MSEYTAKEITAFLRAANFDLGSGKYKGPEMIPDYAKAVIIGKQLQSQLAAEKKKNRWIPVGEGLPEKDGYIVLQRKADPMIIHYFTSRTSEQWFRSYTRYFTLPEKEEVRP